MKPSILGVALLAVLAGCGESDPTFPTTTTTVATMPPAGAAVQATTIQLGESPGFWSNKNGNARLDSAGDGAVDLWVPPDTLGGWPGRWVFVDSIAVSNKILKNDACDDGFPAVFYCAAPPAGQGLSDRLKVGTLNTLAEQTLALYYNIRLIAGFSGQTILLLSTHKNDCADLVTSPITGLGLGPDSTVDAALSVANRLIQYSVADTLGTTTQAQAGAMNSLLGCLNRQRL